LEWHGRRNITWYSARHCGQINGHVSGNVCFTFADFNDSLFREGLGGHDGRQRGVDVAHLGLLGRTSLREVKRKLQDINLDLGMPMPEGFQITPPQIPQ
jgi:hypothetical protein